MDLPDWAQHCMDSINEFIDNGIPPQDAKYLPEYFKTKTLPGILFRRDSDTPLYTRYLLLENMKQLVDLSDALPQPELKATLKNQAQMFKEQADIEFTDSIRAHNLLSLYDWITSNLSPVAGIEKNRKSLTILHAMVEYATPKQHSIPFLLLANFWARKEYENPEMLLMLQWLTQNNDEFSSWIANPDSKFLKDIIFKKLNLS